MSGRLYQSLPRVIQSRFVVPPEVAGIADYDLKYLVILRLALRPRHHLYRIAESEHVPPADRHSERTSRDAGSEPRDRDVRPLDALDAPLRQAIVDRLTPRPDRAARLSGRHADLTYANVWPGIRLMTTWTGGSCGIALGRLREKLPAATAVMELGYQSTEFRGSIALNAETRADCRRLITISSSSSSSRRGTVALRRFRRSTSSRWDERYYVIITTASGLYRYS